MTGKIQGDGGLMGKTGGPPFGSLAEEYDAWYESWPGRHIFAFSLPWIWKAY